MKDASRSWQKHLKHFVLGFSLWAPREKALYSFTLNSSSHISSHQPQQVGSQKPFPPCLWGTGAFHLPVPDVTIYCYSPTLKWKRCSSHSISFPLAAASLSPRSPPSSLMINETLSDFTPAPPTKVKEVEILFQSNVNPWEKNPQRIQRQSLSLLFSLLFLTIPLSPVISCSCSLHCCCLLIKHFDTDPIFVLSNSPLTPFSRVPPTWSRFCFSSHSAYSSSYLSVLLIGIQPSPGCIMKISCSYWQRNH